MVIDTRFSLGNDVKNRYALHHLYMLDDKIEREIVFDANDLTFTELLRFEGINVIENIYTEILPIHIELLHLKQEDMVVRDREGRLTLLTVMPF